MKRLSIGILSICIIVCGSPVYAFVDYLFGGSSNQGAIDNSAVGDLRSWWTGNPVYQFNPYYSGSNANQPGQGNQAMGQQQAAPPIQQPNVTFYPPQGAPAHPQYGAPSAAAPPYGIPQQYAPPPQQAYQAPPQYGPPATGAYQPPAPQAYPPQQAYQPQQQFYNGEGGMYGGAGFVPGQPMQ